MEVAPGLLARTFTAPISSHSRMNNSQSSSTTPNTYSTGSTQLSRSSGLTQDTSASFSFPSHISPPPSGSFIEPTNNVINRVADKETSLYQQCITLRNRLRNVPGFDEEYKRSVEAATHARENPSPVDLLWATFRRGYALIAIFNALQPQTPLEIHRLTKSESKREKDAAYKFVEACHHQLKFPQPECFMIQDLFSEDTSGFVKVVSVVNRVVDILVQEGRIEAHDTDSVEIERRSQRLSHTKRTHRQHIVDELVRTERTYVQHLEILHAFKVKVEQQGLISGDAVHDIFLNLKQLLDVQRKFLIAVEQEDYKDEEEQNWGQVFERFGESFGVYQPYIINQTTCEETAIHNFEKLRTIQDDADLRQIVESPPILTGFLLKPFARLCKYPLLLNTLAEKGQLDEEKRAAIQRGTVAITNILDFTNSYLAKQEQHKIVQDLKDQVEDWKSHRVEAFGDLLLHGTFVVIKGDGMNTEREYRMFLFHKILLCCKEIGTGKKGKLGGRAPPPPTRNGKPRLALKGRIFMANVTETVIMKQSGKSALKIGSDMKIFWRGDESIEYFIIRYPTEEVMKKWIAVIETQRLFFAEESRRNARSTSEMQFKYIQDQGDLINPYRDEDGDDEYPGYADSALARNASSLSLRSRSTTNESIPPGMKTPSLTLRTQQLHNPISPTERYGNSYFSPVAESPTSYSSRTSSSSGVMPPSLRQSGSISGHTEDNNRFTAPAAGYRKDFSHAYHSVDPRSGRYVSPPQAAVMASRMRSASSPDVHTLNTTVRQAGNNGPPIPSVPAHLSNSIVNRSQNNSPLYNNNMRGQTISPPLMSPASSFGDGMMPSQLRVKVKVPSEGSTMVLVVGINITFQQLKDRIDAKLQRHTNLSLANGSVKLKYLYDDEFVTIQTDEDVQTAFETWDQQQSPGTPGQVGEIELYCHR